MGEHDNAFWFYRIIKDSHKYHFQFNVNRPAVDHFYELNLYIIDWYGIIKNVKADNMQMEYSVLKSDFNK